MNTLQDKLLKAQEEIRVINIEAKPLLRKSWTMHMLNSGYKDRMKSAIKNAVNIELSLAGIEYTEELVDKICSESIVNFGILEEAFKAANGSPM